MNFVVFESDMVLVDSVPFLDPDLIGSGAGLGSHQLFEVPYRIIFIAFYSHLLAQSVVQDHLYHPSLPLPLSSLFLLFIPLHSQLHCLHT